MKYTVTGVAFKKDGEGKNGPYRVFRVKFAENPDTVDFPVWGEDEPPKDQDVVFGTIEDRGYGPSFRKDRRQPSSFKPRSRELDPYSMFVAYAKDLIIDYLHYLDWDITKFQPSVYHAAVDNIIEAAKRLQSAEVKKEPPPKEPEFFDPFEVRDIDKI